MPEDAAAAGGSPTDLLWGLTVPDAVASVAKALAILVVTLIAGYIVGKRLRSILILRTSRDLATIISRAASYTIYALGFMAALSQLGVNISVFLLAGGVAGIVIGFASQTIASNLLSGIFLYLDRPFKQGDPVMIGDVGGILHDISIFSTRVRRWDGVLVRIPNETVFRSKIEMLGMTIARRIEYRIPLAKASDVEKARKTIIEVLERDPLVLAEPEPEVFIESLGERGVEINVRIWAPSQKWHTVRTRAIEEIRKALEEAGIEVAAPYRIIEFTGKNGSTECHPRGEER